MAKWLGTRPQSSSCTHPQVRSAALPHSTYSTAYPRNEQGLLGGMSEVQAYDPDELNAWLHSKAGRPVAPDSLYDEWLVRPRLRATA